MSTICEICGEQFDGPHSYVMHLFHDRDKEIRCVPPAQYVPGSAKTFTETEKGWHYG